MRASWGEHWPAAAIVAAAAAMVAPLWTVASPAMPDYPAHLASFYLLAGEIKDPHLSQFYRIEWAWIPNLAAELTVPIIGRLTGMVVATKLFLSAALALWVLGPALVQRALYGRIGVTSLGAAFFAYNANLMWGFFNYEFAAGLSFVVFALWIATGRWNPIARVLVFAVLVLLVYFSHVFAAATLLLLIGCYEATLWLEQKPLDIAAGFRRLLPIGAICLPALAAFVFLKPPGIDGHVTFRIIATWQDRLDAFLQRFFDHPAYILLAVLALLLVLGLWRRVIVLHRHMWLALAMLLLAAIVMPEEAMGGWGLNLRLPAVLGAMVFAAADLRASRRAALAAGAAALAVVVWNAAALAGNWAYCDRQFTEFRAAIRQLPRGVRLLTVLDGDAIGKGSDQVYWHMAEYAIIDRAAFTPLMFTTPGQHVVRRQPAYVSIAARTAKQGSPPDISELDDLAADQVDGDSDIQNVFPYLMRFQCHYDVAVVVHLNGKRSPVPDRLKLLHAGSFFALYKIDPTGCPRK